MFSWIKRVPLNNQCAATFTNTSRSVIYNRIGFSNPNITTLIRSNTRSYAVERTTQPLEQHFFESWTKKEDGKFELIKVGRAWRQSELRLKSFDDLHKLWYVLVKERNLCMSQRERFPARTEPKLYSHMSIRIRKCKLSMARLKSVLSERRKVHNFLEYIRKGGLDAVKAVEKIQKQKQRKVALTTKKREKRHRKAERAASTPSSQTKEASIVSE
eukprot:TRINITY_DN12819_c0_g1_i1.p1 TRINITY_DN12819_c0_g1~~TRINITY_DN12819_c0_g1_i1.p1  ORF type:complete len:215 (+),score=30.72 TRINITY_DN12819_c0_g1_i1:141-785(+)